jgi:hypothetical protein
MRINVNRIVTVDMSLTEIEAAAMAAGLQDSLNNPSSTLTPNNREIIGGILNGLFASLDATSGDTL